MELLLLVGIIVLLISSLGAIIPILCGVVVFFVICAIPLAIFGWIVKFAYQFAIFAIREIRFVIREIGVSRRLANAKCIRPDGVEIGNLDELNEYIAGSYDTQ